MDTLGTRVEYKKKIVITLCFSGYRMHILLLCGLYHFSYSFDISVSRKYKFTFPCLFQLADFHLKKGRREKKLTMVTQLQPTTRAAPTRGDNKDGGTISTNNTSSPKSKEDGDTTSTNMSSSKSKHRMVTQRHEQPREQE